MNELDSYQGPALVIATTNKLGEIDKTVRRGGRLDLDIRMDMPADSDRFKIFKSHLQGMQGMKDDELVMMARVVSGFVSSDLA